MGAGGTEGTLGTNSVSIASSAFLTFNRTDLVVVTNVISGDGVVKQIGSGTLALISSNSYAGGTTVSNGTIGVYHNSALGSGDVSMANGTTFLLGRAVTQIANNLALTGTVTADFDTSVDYLIVGAGGGGGSDAGGGGGGGAIASSSIDTTSYTSLTATVGTGGSGGAWSNGTSGTAGGNSS